MTEGFIYILAGTLAAATPILFAALGELVVERSGILNLSLEGMMAIGAASAFVAATVSGSHAIGFATGAAAAGLLAIVFACLALFFLASQVAAGLAVGFLGLGLSALIGKDYEGTTIKPLAEWAIPGLAEIPIVGEILFRQDLSVYAGWVMLLVVWGVLVKTKLGLIIRAVGEAPHAARTIGYRVVLIRFACVLFGGILAGIGGASLSLAYTPLWADGLVAGRGWIAVALVVFAAWRAPRLILGAWLFGAVSLIELFVQGQGLALPSQLLSAAPYIVTIVVLVMISRDRRKTRLNSPQSLGEPYRNGE